MTGKVVIDCVQLDHGKGLPLPSYESTGAAGMDLYAALPEGGDVILAPGKRQLIPTGLSIALPQGYEAQIRPRSGLAFKHGITLVNAPGTIDSDYRGEIGMLLINLGEEPFTIRRGERVGQMVIAAYVQAEWQAGDGLSETERGSGGFGSTGTGGSAD
jgi:dUTP pyrophosphatase